MYTVYDMQCGKFGIPHDQTSLVPRPHPAFRHLQYSIYRLHVGRAWEWGYDQTLAAEIKKIVLPRATGI